MIMVGDFSLGLYCCLICYMCYGCRKNILLHFVFYIICVGGFESCEMVITALCVTV